MVAREKARRVLSELLDCLSDLERYRDRLTPAELRESRDAQHMVLRALYVAAQSAVDLAMHVAADAGLPQAATYGDAFRRLAESGRIDRALAERLAGWAGFRNVLARSYAVLDLDRFFQTLSETGDLERFAAFVAGEIGPA